MTDQEQINRLERRVDNIETDIREQLGAIFTKLTAIEIAAARSQCPAPGKCLQLDTALGSSVLRIERLEMRMMAIERWRSWLTGIGFAFGIVVGYILQFIK